jgi:hypothetical protein
MTHDGPVPAELRSPAPRAPKKSSVPSKQSPNDDEASVEEKVRKDEVEAALKSEPQRGRKRENLNAEERLELTRTRNREHAKSTRIRKKQRYQDLLDIEQRYLELQKVEDLNSNRRGAVLGFLSARENMLNRVVENTMHPGKATVQEEGQKRPAQDLEDPEIENPVVSFDSFDDSAPKKVTPTKSEDDDDHSNISPDAYSLGEIVQDMKRFKFETSLVS